MHIANQNKPIWIGYILYEPTFWKRQNYRDSKKINWGQGGTGEKRKVKHRVFLEQWNFLYDTVMVNSCPQTFFKTQKY